MSTANGNETNKAKIHARISLLPGKIFEKQMTISAIEKTIQPSMIGSFFPFDFANLLTNGYMSNDPAIEIARINTEYVSASPISDVT